MNHLNLESLGPRYCPTPWVVLRDGARAADIEQGWGPNCMWLATLASAADQGVDLAGRLHHTGPGRWLVDLHASTGVPAAVPVSFSGRLSPLDPVPRHGEYWPVLFDRAARRLAPGLATIGIGADVADGLLFGRLPRLDGTPREVGLGAIGAALDRGSVVVCCSDYHAYSVLRTTDHEVVLYDPWGRVRRMPPVAFLRKPFEVAVF